MEHPEFERSHPRGYDGKFIKGQPRPAVMPRRAKGRANKLTRDIKHGITEAAVRHGSDGKGKDGLIGFFQFLLLTDLRAFAGLIGRLIPFQVSGVPEGGTVNVTISPVPSGHFLTLEEARSMAGYTASSPVLALTPGITIGTPPGAPALTVIEGTADELPTTDPAPQPEPTEPPPPPPRTANNAPSFEFSRGRRRSTPFDFK